MNSILDQRATEKRSKLNESNHSIKSGFSINEGKDSLTPASQLPFSNGILGTRPLVHKQTISSFQQQQQISSFYTPDKRKKIAAAFKQQLESCNDNLTPMVQQVEPENILNQNQIVNHPQNNQPTSSFIQNITNSFVME